MGPSPWRLWSSYRGSAWLPLRTGHLGGTGKFSSLTLLYRWGSGVRQRGRGVPGPKAGQLQRQPWGPGSLTLSQNSSCTPGCPSRERGHCQGVSSLSVRLTQQNSGLGAGERPSLCHPLLCLTLGGLPGRPGHPGHWRVGLSLASPGSVCCPLWLVQCNLH